MRYEDIVRHVGHRIEAVTYGSVIETWNASVECIDCSEVIVTEDAPGVLHSEVCTDCGQRIEPEDEVWMTKDGVAAGPPVGDPYHVEHAPEEVG